ncbi:MAG: helix-turn-helix domain-containing protein [Gammaproteobacteria bacterium]
MGYSWAPYVPVAKRREQALRAMNKMKKKGADIQPIHIEGRKIARKFWGESWCSHIESFSDYENRLPRGRTYVRNGSVCHLAINNSLVNGIVSGSQLYNVNIKIKPLPKSQWQAIKSNCSGEIGSLLELLSGQLSDKVMAVVCDPHQGLFPLTKEIELSCDCPDWAIMCKHVAAVLYGVASRLDHSPEQLFHLRGVNHEELVDIPSVVSRTINDGKASRRRISDDTISQVFDIDLSTPEAGKSSAELDIENDMTSQQDIIKSSPNRVVTSKRKQRIQITKKSGVKSTKKQTLLSNKGKKSKVQTVTSTVSSPTSKKLQRKITQKKTDLPKYLSGYGLRKKRLLLSLTQSELATLIGVSASTISRWEYKGRKKLRLQQKVLDKLYNL